MLFVSSELPANCVMVSGSSSNELAKIGGMTPAVLSFSGKWLRSACIMPRWVARLGYWISKRRCARSTKLITRIRITIMAMKPTMITGEIEPVRPPSNRFAAKLGNCATIPAMMIRETPLPMPRLVICSPSQSRNIVPPTRLITAPIRNM